MKLTKEQYIRYSRQMILPELQGEGQEKIFQAKVLLVGLGGLGSPQALYLAAAGVGTLGLLDGDRVDLTNLQRQVVHSTDDLGSPKVISAQRRIHSINPEVEVRTHDERLTSENAIGILSEYDIIVDCTDNFPARYLMNDACVLLGKPLVHGAIYRFEGQATVFHPAREGPCYRCLFPVPPSPGMVPSCAESGVLGVLPGVVGSIQATEVTKLILGAGRPLIGRLLFCDLLSTQFQELTIRRDPNCPVCGEDPSIRGLIDYEEFCGLRAQEGYGFQGVRVDREARPALRASGHGVGPEDAGGGTGPLPRCPGGMGAVDLSLHGRHPHTLQQASSGMERPHALQGPGDRCLLPVRVEKSRGGPTPHRQGVQECLEPGRWPGGVDPVPGGIDSKKVDMNHANVALNADGRGPAR